MLHCAKKNYLLMFLNSGCRGLIESVHSFSYKTYYLHKILDTESCNWLIKIMKQQDMFNVEIISITSYNYTSHAIAH